MAVILSAQNRENQDINFNITKSHVFTILYDFLVVYKMAKLQYNSVLS